MQRDRSRAPIGGFACGLDLSLCRKHATKRRTGIDLIIGGSALGGILTGITRKNVCTGCSNTRLLPRSCCRLSSRALALRTNRAGSSTMSMAICSDRLITTYRRTREGLLCMLPLTVRNSSSCKVGSGAGALVLLFGIACMRSTRSRGKPRCIPSPGSTPRAARRKLILGFRSRFGKAKRPS